MEVKTRRIDRILEHQTSYGHEVYSIDVIQWKPHITVRGWLEAAWIDLGCDGIRLGVLRTLGSERGMCWAPQTGPRGARAASEDAVVSPKILRQWFK